jgi:hypothetical protein
MENNAQQTEIWKQYLDTRYEVSNLGNVRNKITKTILSPEDTGRGYLCVGLHMPDGSYKKTRVHRMVAMAFLEVERTAERNEVDHLNGNKTDNSVDNLRWCTHKENMNNPVTLNKIRSRAQKCRCNVYFNL